jgi:hypothetical protein
MNESKKRHHRRFSGIRSDLDVSQALQKHLPDSVDLTPSKLIGEPLGGFALLGWEGLGARSSLGPSRDMQFLHQPSDERSRINSKVMRFIEIGERGSSICRENMLKEAPDSATVGKAEHFAHLLSGDRTPSMSNCLVEDGEAVTSRAFGRARDHAQSVIFHVDAFCL